MFIVAGLLCESDKLVRSIIALTKSIIKAGSLFVHERIVRFTNKKSVD